MRNTFNEIQPHRTALFGFIVFLLCGIVGCATNRIEPQNTGKPIITQRPIPFQPGNSTEDCNTVLSTIYVNDYRLNTGSELDEVLTEAVHWSDQQKTQIASSASGGIRIPIAKILIGAQGDYAKSRLEDALKEFSSQKTASTRERALLQLSSYSTDNETSRKALDAWKYCISKPKVQGSRIEMSSQVIDDFRLEVVINYMPLTVNEPEPILTAINVDGGAIQPDTRLAIGDALTAQRERKIVVKRADASTAVYVQVRTDSISDASVTIMPTMSPTRKELLKEIQDLKALEQTLDKEKQELMQANKGLTEQVSSLTANVSDLTKYKNARFILHVWKDGGYKNMHGSVPLDSSFSENIKDEWGYTCPHVASVFDTISILHDSNTNENFGRGNAPHTIVIQRILGN